MHLIGKKIEVPQVDAAVARDRLVETLFESLHSCSSTLLVGRAGTGKTTVAAQFARTCGRRAVWYEIDASDSAPGVFFAYTLTALDRYRPGIARDLRALGSATPDDDMTLLSAVLVNALVEHAGDPLLFVLDNLHHLYDAPWFATFIGRFLLLLPEDVHVLAIGRGVPPGPIWRLRSKQMLCLVDESQLAFTVDEAKRLFSKLGVSATLAADAVAMTHGRAGLLAATARDALRPTPHKACERPSDMP